MISPVRLRPAEIPVTPDGPEAQRWLQDELLKAPYEAARPTWFDRLSQSFFDWLGSLRLPDGGVWNSWLPALVIAVVLVAIGAAWLIFGVPRRNRRRAQATDLFGTDDRRSAADMRRAAQAAAQAGNWSLAAEEIFRALAADMFERTVVSVTPGTTAHGFAERAAAAFPAARDGLIGAADVFDRVRYLGVSGAEADFRTLEALEGELRRAAPARLATPSEQSVAARQVSS
ncbi:DUF4129 domain-containing protein [Cryobacterium psychrophilum]|uniref:DUF4129 domain-containing protein n=1 Tax=Cryobacterium psychrophilum TaxID=41988 RepID=A0A4Y8KKH0_9MICO|nr:DUF4129 domain-containing protein [Cryobacterium psychrophilum]TDW30739.1 uncharacterized protein DUF4129 [Cryobacterium psychrophilum]TFD75855.1 DUF4129 domain-containing protein [Cryobacterium psychrophilum]